MVKLIFAAVFFWNTLWKDSVANSKLKLVFFYSSSSSLLYFPQSESNIYLSLIKNTKVAVTFIFGIHVNYAKNWFPTTLKSIIFLCGAHNREKQDVTHRAISSLSCLLVQYFILYFFFLSPLSCFVSTTRKLNKLFTGNSF